MEDLNPHFYTLINVNPAKFDKKRLPIFRDNLNQYRGFTPYFNKNAEVIAPQPDGSFFKGYQQVRQCQAVISNMQCKNHTMILPFCEEHTRQYLKLETKTSTIKEAGLGVFAYGGPNATENTIVFRKGDFIHYFEGEILDYKSYEERYGAHLDKTGVFWFSPYAASINDKYICDPIIVRGILGYINDCLCEQKYNVYEKSEEDDFVIKCFASRDIYHGEELFMEYGDPWWFAYPKSQCIGKL